MKLKTEKEIEVLAHDHALICLYEHRQIAYFSYKSGYSQAQQDLLASASEGFEDFCESNTSRYFGLGAFQRELDEKLWQAAKLSQAKEISDLREEINFLKAANAKLEEARVSHLEENERLQKENQEMRGALGEAIKILNDGCLVYDQHVPSGSSSFRADAQWFIDTNSSKLSNSSKEEVK